METRSNQWVHWGACIMYTIADALSQALAYHQAGQLQAAEQLYRQILQVEPNQSDAWQLLGVMAHQVGQNHVSLEYIERAIAIRKDVPDYYNNLGRTYQVLGRLEDAAQCYRKALELNPAFGLASINLGNTLKEQNKFDEAAACYQSALEIRPDFPEVLNNLAVIFMKLNKPDAAVANCQRAIKLRPDLAQAHHNLANALMVLRRMSEAESSYRQALALQPNLVEAHTNLGFVLKEQGRLDEAAASCRRAVELNPNDAQAHSNLGLTLVELRCLDGAMECYRRALALQPDFPEVHLHLASLCLLQGDFKTGWSEYEWRQHDKRFRQISCRQSIWDGASLAGKSILLYSEQGIGDTIQFIRYAARLKQLASRVIGECDARLIPLLSSCANVDSWVSQPNELPPFDVYAPLLSLPRLLDTQMDTIPADIPYLFADPALVQQWQQKLEALSGFKIGIVWQGSSIVRSKDIPLQNFAPLAQVPGVRLISLQKGPGIQQLNELADAFSVTDLGNQVDETAGAFMDTAAVIMNLDLVVTVDTSAAHLAGALGAPVWVALPFAPDWRWLLDRSDSPWYPTMRLFRQKTPGDWIGVIAEIRDALREQIESHDAVTKQVTARVNCDKKSFEPDMLVPRIANLQMKRTNDWHLAEPFSVSPDDSEFFQLVEREHRYNFDLWHEEDHARAPNAADSQIAAVKRRIDKLNQQRHELIERLDDWLLELFQKNGCADPTASWNTETPGAAIDRLSILALKIYHMAEEETRLDASATHHEHCAACRQTLEQQRSDLVLALQTLFDDLFEGRKVMKTYRQFKMYNDPDLNPEIYVRVGRPRCS